MYSTKIRKVNENLAISNLEVAIAGRTISQFNPMESTIT